MEYGYYMKNMVFSSPQAKNRPESGVSEHRVSELASPPPLSGQIGDADPLYDLDHPYRLSDRELEVLGRTVS